MQEKSTATRRPTASSYRPFIRRLARGVYEIESRTTQGATYVVTLTGLMSYTCTCPAFEYGRGCWHHGAARQASAFFIKWYSQALPVLAAAPAAESSPVPAVPFHQTAGYKGLAEAFA